MPRRPVGRLMRTATNKSEERPARQHVRRRQGALCPCDTNSGALEFDVTLLGLARAQGLFLGVEVWRLDVALQQAAYKQPLWKNALRKRSSAPATSSSCEPPSDQPQEACLPPMSGGAASAGVCLPTPCMRHRCSACATSRGEAPRAPSVAFCIVQGSVLPFGDAPCVCFNGRENRGRGRPVSTARKATRDCRDFASMSTVRWHPRGESDRRRSKGPCYNAAPRREAPKVALRGKGRIEKCMLGAKVEVRVSAAWLRSSMRFMWPRESGPACFVFF